MIDLSQFSPKEKKVNKKINILWVRALHNMYNPKMAIDVVKFISNQNIDVHMVMVGPDKDNLNMI